MDATKAGAWVDELVDVSGYGKGVTLAASSASSLDVVWGDEMVSKWVGVRAASLTVSTVSWVVDWVVQTAHWAAQMAASSDASTVAWTACYSAATMVA
jgi:hypothetical protein